MVSAADRARQLALVSRLKTTFPEVPEWPTPDMITHDHYLAYMKTSHDVGGELNVPELYENKEEEQWELMTTCSARCSAGVASGSPRSAGGSATSTSDARFTSAFRTTPGGCGRWAGC